MPAYAADRRRRSGHRHGEHRSRAVSSRPGVSAGIRSGCRASD